MPPSKKATPRACDRLNERGSDSTHPAPQTAVLTERIIRRYPVTLLLLFVASVCAVIGWITAPNPTINGAKFLGIVFVMLAMLALWVERSKVTRRR
jgi:hypothetical protein